MIFCSRCRVSVSGYCYTSPIFHKVQPYIPLTVNPHFQNLLAVICSPYPHPTLWAGFSLWITSVVVGLVLVILVMTCKLPSAETIRKLWKRKKFITYESWKSYGKWDHTEKWRQGSVWGPAVLLLLSLRVEPRISQDHSLYKWI